MLRTLTSHEHVSEEKSFSVRNQARRKEGIWWARGVAPQILSRWKTSQGLIVTHLPSRLSLTTEAQVRPQTSQSGFCGGQIDTEIGSLPVRVSSAVNYIGSTREIVGRVAQFI
jgi:hypothetical protein